MKKISPLASFVLNIGLVGVGVIVGSVVSGITRPAPTPLPPAPPPRIPVLSTDVRALVEALQPFEHGMPYDRVEVCVRGVRDPAYGNGKPDVTIEFHPAIGAAVKMAGADIPSAIKSGTQFNGRVDAALAPFVPAAQP